MFCLIPGMIQIRLMPWLFLALLLRISYTDVYTVSGDHRNNDLRYTAQTTYILPCFYQSSKTIWSYSRWSSVIGRTLGLCTSMADSSYSGFSSTSDRTTKRMYGVPVWDLVSVCQVAVVQYTINGICLCQTQANNIVKGAIIPVVKQTSRPDIRRSTYKGPRVIYQTVLAREIWFLVPYGNVRTSRTPGPTLDSR